MKRLGIPVLLLTFIVIAGAFFLLGGNNTTSQSLSNPSDLPPIDSEKGLANLIYYRQSERSFTNDPLSQEDIAYLLWAGEGITVDGVSGPTRSSPSAGATDPLELFILANNVEGLEKGVYRYSPEAHELTLAREGELGGDLAQAALGQTVIRDAPAVFIVAANYDRTTGRYGERGVKYVHFEGGHAGQNINLMAEERGLGGVIIGAFDNSSVKQIIGVEDEDPLLIIPIGHPR